MALDRATTKLAWELAKIAYQLDAAIVERDVAALGLGGVRPYDMGGSTQAFGCSDGERFFVAFRGTEAQPVDWITDGRFGPISGPLGGRVHSGFALALNEVWDDLAGTVPSGKTVWFTGHSLGAALAMLAAARHVEAGGAVAGVYTFGQPRTGLADFAATYGARLGDVTFRFVNHIDLVTRVPLLVQGFRHAGRRMYWDRSGDFHEDASWWQVAKEDLLYRITHFGRIQSVGLAPHFAPAYSERVRAL